MKVKNLMMNIVAVTAIFTTTAHAGGVAADSAKAVQHSGQAVVHASSAGAKSVAGVAAVPLKAVGKVGELSTKAGDALWDSANEPLDVSEKIYTTAPSPDQMQ